MPVPFQRPDAEIYDLSARIVTPHPASVNYLYNFGTVRFHGGQQILSRDSITFALRGDRVHDRRSGELRRSDDFSKNSRLATSN